MKEGFLYLDLVKHEMIHTRECRHGGYCVKRASGYFTLAYRSVITLEVPAGFIWIFNLVHLAVAQ